MDTITQYQNLIKSGLSHYAELLMQPPPPPYKIVKVFDDVNHQYILRKLGWEETKRISHIVLHVALYDEKIWIEEDWTEEGIATYFLEHGVSEKHIVLGFHAPEMRKFSSFAVA